MISGHSEVHSAHTDEMLRGGRRNVIPVCFSRALL